MDVLAEMAVGVVSAVFVFTLYRHAATKTAKNSPRRPELYQPTDLFLPTNELSVETYRRMIQDAVAPSSQQGKVEMVPYVDRVRDPTKIMIEAMCGPGVCTPRL